MPSVAHNQAVARTILRHYHKDAPHGITGKKTDLDFAIMAEVYLVHHSESVNLGFKHFRDHSGKLTGILYLAFFNAHVLIVTSLRLLAIADSSIIMSVKTEEMHLAASDSGYALTRGTALSQARATASLYTM